MRESVGKQGERRIAWGAPESASSQRAFVAGFVVGYVAATACALIMLVYLVGPVLVQAR